MESLSVGKINLARRGKSLECANIVPRHSAGISRQAPASVIPANEPVATRHFTSESHASPTGSARLDFSGYSGAREREPHRRGLNVGSMRNGSGFIIPGCSFVQRDSVYADIRGCCVSIVDK